MNLIFGASLARWQRVQMQRVVVFLFVTFVRLSTSNITYSRDDRWEYMWQYGWNLEPKIRSHSAGGGTHSGVSDERHKRRQRRLKRSCGAGVLTRLRGAPPKPAMPSIYLTNSTLLSSKADDLVMTIGTKTVLDCSLTETWLHSGIPDEPIMRFRPHIVPGTPVFKDNIRLDHSDPDTNTSRLSNPDNQCSKWDYTSQCRQQALERPTDTLTAKPGEDVILPCHCDEDHVIELLEWSRPELKSDDYVLYYRKKVFQNYQHPCYHGRVVLMDPEMKNGDASVILKNITINDTGTYQCQIGGAKTRRTKRNADEVINTIKLEVTGARAGGRREHLGLAVGLVVFVVVAVVGFLGFTLRRRLMRKNSEMPAAVAAGELKFKEIS